MCPFAYIFFKTTTCILITFYIYVPSKCCMREFNLCVLVKYNLHRSRPALKLSQPSIQWIMGGAFLGDKVTGCEARAKVRNEWSHTSTPTAFVSCTEGALLFAFIWIFVIYEINYIMLLNAGFLLPIIESFKTVKLTLFLSHPFLQLVY